MKDYVTKNIRNIGLVGHGGEGKTILAEAMLYNAGQIDRMGKVENGNTVTDFDSEETSRGISVSLALAAFEWNNTKINIIDMPGYFDMVGEVFSGLKVVDSAVIVISATSGLEVGAEKAWDYCEANGVAKMFFINQMDKENANFDKVLDQLTEKYGTSVAPIQLPIREGGKLIGYVDMLKDQAYKFNDTKFGKEEIEIPDDIHPHVNELEEILMESAASASEELMENTSKTVSCPKKIQSRSSHGYHRGKSGSCILR